MEYHYTLEEEDFLDFQLFTASQSLQIAKKRRKQWILLTSIPLLFALSFYFQRNMALVNYFSVIAVIFSVFYPTYFKWRYIQHYKSYNQENYAQRFGQPITLKIYTDYIFSKDQSGESKINRSEIEGVDEIQRLIFIKISNGHALVIPKHKINITSLKHDFKRLNLEIKEHLNWKW